VLLLLLHLGLHELPCVLEEVLVVTVVSGTVLRLAVRKVSQARRCEGLSSRLLLIDRGLMII